MRLLLLQDVRKLGHIGDIVDVSIGYARNYLLPQRLAAEPSEQNIKSIESAKVAAALERTRRVKEFEALVERLNDASVTIEAAANPEGTLYGSVGARDIAAALQAQGFPVATEHVVLDGPIRNLDNRTVKLEFTDDISTQVKVWVVREGAVDAQQDESAAGAESEEDDE